MKVTIIKPRGSEVADKWKAQYRSQSGVWKDVVGSSEKIYEGIVAAGDDLDAIDKVIGNKSWTRTMCGNCTNYTRTAIEFGEYETFLLCPFCISQAKAVIDSCRESL